MQLKLVVAPTKFENSFVPQERQSAEPVLSWYVFIGQLKHVLEPDEDANVPVVQLKQSNTLIEPVLVEYKPLAQAMHDAFPVPS